ncbi:MAG: translesion error-prone DNA polymerase V autoproteolytic subunit [Rikenellaceae bacterium]
MNDFDTQLEIMQPQLDRSVEIPMASSGVSAGFPSPADDYRGLKLDLNRELISNPASTFFARVSGVSMVDSGVDDGDLLVIDKSVTPYNGCLAICYVDGEFTVKRYENHGDYALLIPSNANYQPLRVTPDDDFRIWGVVRYVIKKV